MKKAFLLITVLCVAVFSTACINNVAVQELNTKAKVYLENGDYEKAISRLQSSIDLDNTFFETHYNLGIAYTQAEDYEKAILSFKKALDLKSDFNELNYSLAVAQENFAKSIMDGSYQEKKKKELCEEPKDEENVEETSDKVKLNNFEKDKVLTLLSEAIESYQKYISNDEIKDKEKVESHIKELDEKILELKNEHIVE